MNAMSAPQTKRRATTLVLFTITLTLIIFLLNSTPKHHPNPTHHLHKTTHLQSTIHQTAITAHCSGTPYPDLCMSALAASNLPQLTFSSDPLPHIICSILNHTAASVQASASQCRSLLHSKKAHLDQRQPVALSDCLELFDETTGDLNKAILDLEKHPTTTLDDMRTVLSAAITNQYSCLDGFAHENASYSLRPLIEGRLLNISHLVSNSLAIAKKIHGKKPNRTSEVFEDYGKIVNGFPEWISASDKQLLKDNITVADLVVAKDGSGNFTTVMDAVNATKDKSKIRIVIYIKQGVYLENVEVVKKKTNLMFVGDGIEKTVIKASRNVADGLWTTYRSATVAIVGPGFIARDITFENSAGPEKHQAVALRSNADFSAFYRCSFVGYQDTLYAHSMRQFYRECDIYGTVDFIFGNAAVVFQNCNIYARKPLVNQKNIITAQGREDPNQNTGISIQNCKVSAASDLLPVQSQFKSYLGRPWKMYSRTVYMLSYLDSLIDPVGWLEWSGNFALDTLYYGEYKNRGPGSNTTRRVNWTGYRVINSSIEASKFTVGSFIEGDEWIGSTAIPFTTGLT